LGPQNLKWVSDEGGNVLEVGKVQSDAAKLKGAMAWSRFGISSITGTIAGWYWKLGRV